MIVVGDRSDALVRTTVQLAEEYELDTACCHDVYSAVAELADVEVGAAMVIGQFDELKRENEALFALVGRSRTACCCLLDAESIADRKAILYAVRVGVRLMGEVSEVRECLERWLATDRCGVGNEGLDIADCRATEAELEALLGQETDG